jgi:hypothetical protein
VETKNLTTCRHFLLKTLHKIFSRANISETKAEAECARAAAALREREKLLKLSLKARETVSQVSAE